MRDADRLGSHLASCTECRRLYDEVRRAVDDVPQGRRTFRRPLGWKGVLLRHAGVAALALSIVGVTIALAHRETPPQTSAPNPTARAVAGGVPLAVEPLDARTLVRALHAFDEYPPSRAAAYTIGLLRTYGVPLDSASLAFRAATTIVAEPGDTWDSIAEKALGDRALWPMVVLLNLELTRDGEFVPAGTFLRVPLTAIPGGSR